MAVDTFITWLPSPTARIDTLRPISLTLTLY
jgi:hypothetical protein